jgi:hypothetical protein
MMAFKKLLTYHVFCVGPCVFYTHHFGKGAKTFVINYFRLHIFPRLILLPQ